MITDPYFDNRNSRSSNTPLEIKLIGLKPGDEVNCLVGRETYQGKFIRVQGDQYYGEPPEIVIDCGAIGERIFPESTVVV